MSGPGEYPSFDVSIQSTSVPLRTVYVKYSAVQEMKAVTRLSFATPLPVT